MKDHHLRAWLKVADLRSIRAAARSLHLSQAAVTKAIKELEGELDAPLVTRSSKGIVITECGEHLTVRARMAETQLNLARQDIQQLLSGARAWVSVGVTPMVMLSVLPDVLSDFRRSMPAARVRISEGLLPSVLPALRNGTLDFAVAARMASVRDDEYAFEPLRPLEFMICGRRGHPLVRARRWEEVVDCEWLLNVSAGSQTEAFLDGLRLAGAALPERVVECDTFGVMWNLMTRSDALLICPSAMLKVKPYSADVERIRVKVPMPAATIGIIRPQGAPLSLAAATMAEIFRRRVAGPSAVVAAQRVK